MEDGLNSVMMEFGGQCVMTSGILLMLKLCVNNWASL